MNLPPTRKAAGNGSSYPPRVPMSPPLHAGSSTTPSPRPPLCSSIHFPSDEESSRSNITGAQLPFPPKPHYSFPWRYPQEHMISNLEGQVYPATINIFLLSVMCYPQVFLYQLDPVH
ncbi:hypothetical protein LIER_25061 [Lithospermum erythrorhizon]|uniref:Uncharacterized protein n=1 Tax=Lithospermum erythrorhizon TaxID=34254 RepID=A0AAV3R6N8_LITER